MSEDKQAPQYDPSAQNFHREAMPDPSKPMPDDIDVQARQQNIQGQASLAAGSNQTLRNMKGVAGGACLIAVMLAVCWFLFFRGCAKEEIEEKPRVGHTTSSIQVHKPAYDKMQQGNPNPNRFCC